MMLLSPAISQSGHLSPAVSQTGQSPHEISQVGQSSPAISQSEHYSLAISQTGHSSRAISQTEQASLAMSQTGHSTRAISQSGQSSRAISQIGQLSPAVSQTGHSSHATCQSGYSSRVISQTGHSSRAISQAGQSSHAISQTGQTSSAISQSGQANDSGSVNDQKTAACIVSSVFRRVTQCIEDREEILQGIQSLTQAQHNVYSFPYANATESLTNFASEFVNSVINEAQIRIKQDSPDSQIGNELDKINAKMYPNTKEAKDTRPSVFEMAGFFIYRILSEAKERVDQIKWIGVDRVSSYTSVEDFKVKDGLEIVARCISTWSFNPHWYFKIIYNGRSVSDTYSYFYTVRWSAPSLSYPVAQVAADIYFVIEVFPMTPPPVHIQVSYRLETDCSNRCAVKTPFLEKWIRTVIKRKLEAFQMFTF